MKPVRKPTAKLHASAQKAQNNAYNHITKQQVKPAITAIGKRNNALSAVTKKPEIVMNVLQMDLLIVLKKVFSKFVKIINGSMSKTAVHPMPAVSIIQTTDAASLTQPINVAMITARF